MRKLVITSLIALAVVTFAPTTSVSQTVDNTLYIKQFPGNDVGTKVSNAMKACNPDSAIPCILVIDPSLAAYPNGIMPTLCAQCSLADYRQGMNLSGASSGAALPDGYSLINCWGNSIAFSSGDTSTAGGWCGMLSNLLGFNANNQGVGGQSSSQVRARMGAAGNLTTVTVSGNQIPAGPNCSVTLTWNNAGYEAGYGTNTFIPSTTQAPAPYNNDNGSTVGGLWGTIQGVDGQIVQGFWNGSGWTNDGTYHFTPLTCPQSPVSVPSGTLWTPKLFTYMNGLHFIEGGYNNVQATGGVTQVKADFDAEISVIPGMTGQKRIVLFPVMYSALWGSGSPQANNVASVNGYLSSVYSKYWAVVNNQNLLQYLSSLYNPANAVDVYEQTWNPLVVPSSLRSFLNNAGTLTSAISDTNTCTFTTSVSTAAYEFITVDNEKIRLNPCTRGFGSTTPATHLNGAAFGAQDTIHPNTAGYTAIANFFNAWVKQNAVNLLGKYVNDYSLGQALKNPNPAVYALPNSRNTFTQNQTIAPASPATASTTTVNSPYMLYSGFAWDSGSSTSKTLQYGVNVIPFSPTSAAMVWAPITAGISTAYIFDNAPFSLNNTAAATAGGNQPSYSFSYSGNCWNGSASGQEKISPTPFSLNGIYGLNFIGSSFCNNTFDLQENGTSLYRSIQQPSNVQWIATSAGAGTSSGYIGITQGPDGNPEPAIYFAYYISANNWSVTVFNNLGGHPRWGTCSNLTGTAPNLGTPSGCTSSYMMVAAGAPSSGKIPVASDSSGDFNFSSTSGAGNVLLQQAPTVTQAMVAGGTQSISGCSLSLASGGQSAGKFASGTSGTCTVVIIPGNTAPNGFRCSATDITTGANIPQSATSTTTCTISGTTTSGDTVTWQAIAY